MIKHKAHVKTDSRFALDTRGHAKFESVLKTIEDNADSRELFPRPTKNSDAVQSYGVILFHRVEDSIKYFACQRRTTIEFSEIVKCGYRKERLFYYLSNMTQHERKLLLTTPLETLWNDLLLSEANLFNDTKTRVTAVHENYKPYLRNLLDCTISDVTEPPYEFPKGRPNYMQDKTLLGTALRELREESGIDLGVCVKLYDDISVIDNYKGTDGVKYQTIYFIIEVDELYQPETIRFQNRNVIADTCISKDMFAGKWIELSTSAPLIPKTTPLPERLETLLFKIHTNLCS